MAKSSESQGLRYKDMVAVVTGGCCGIGRGCVDVLVEQGGRVAVWDINDKEGATITGNVGNGEMYFVHCDTTKEESVKAAVQKTVEKFGRIDCLVNNAGWHPPAKTIDEFTVEDFKTLIDLNLVGYFMCSKYTLPFLRQSKGNIINVSSAASYGQPEAVTYCATKGGVTSFTKGLALDEAKHGVRVNCISPGATMTPLLQEWLETVPPEQRKQSKKANIFGRFCEAREIGQVCLFLATDATYITGLDLNAAGCSDIGLWK